ncbi:unnamed protein product [Cuscuta europaea]|uniref:RING-type domain-containing protein n=2 Tax=Cuscuta europaea TaxID=41803 RepID=A0A9P0YZD9_CUSEU|nr:unnamed protein product [Cuscuta europaea]
MPNLVVKVRREAIAACMTCPLCNKLFRDATTISECLHTFCRKCIYKKLQDEETECCPICNIDLGCVPVEKLRADHNLQDVRAKIFPYKRQKVNKTPEIEIVVPSVTTMPTARRKERSLSSLVVSTPRVSSTKSGGMTGRRSKSIARKPMRGGSSFYIEKPTKNEENSTEDRLAESSKSSPETLNKFTNNIRLNNSSSHAEPSDQPKADRGGTQYAGKEDLWKPLSCLVEAANRTKPSMSSSSQGYVNGEPVLLADNEDHTRKIKDNGYKLNAEENNTYGNHAQPESEKPKKTRRVRKKDLSFGDFGVSPQAVVDATTALYERSAKPIWFSLVATANQEGETPLPQISACYLRIKDGSIPVSYIQKYLMRKLDLKSEDEIEIRCMGQSIAPTLQLNNLVDLWLQMANPEKVSATIGSSGKDFVMVLAYCRRPVQPLF